MRPESYSSIHHHELLHYGRHVHGLSRQLWRRPVVLLVYVTKYLREMFHFNAVKNPRRGVPSLIVGSTIMSCFTMAAMSMAF